MTQFKFKVGQRVRIRVRWAKDLFGISECKILSTDSGVTGRPYVVDFVGIYPCFPEDELELADEPKPD